MIDFKGKGGISIGSKFVNDSTLARLGWAVPAVTLSLAMLIHWLSGDARAVPFFISESDYPGLQRIIFTSGVFISGFIICTVSFRMWWTQRQDCRPKLLFISMLCGFYTGINISLMAFANMYDFLELHVFTALGVFQVGMAWALVSHFALPNAQKKGKMMRWLAMVVSFISFNVMSATLAGAVKGMTTAERQDALTQLTPLQSAIDIAAPAEYFLVIGLFIALASFESDMQVKEIIGQDSEQ
ncbi:MAG: hypothetical protein HOL72_01090 [Euryarchaeota archaeon]|nr:hypothetical protein [Euryarchaeota archaeon]MDG1546552.1 hypothetical protein [Candidatus Poseidoniaceae archaeon]